MVCYVQPSTVQEANGEKLEAHSLCSVAINMLILRLPFCISVTWMFIVILFYSLIPWHTYAYTHMKSIYHYLFSCLILPQPFFHWNSSSSFHIFCVRERLTEFKQGCMYGHGWGELLEHGHLNQLYHRRKWCSYPIPAVTHTHTHKQPPFTVSSPWAFLDGMVMGSVSCR